ncbi:apoptosis regulatory protein Siva isoform X2 [Anolis carolinensis]|uniref:apoptosis regulatory protein Siva isoform X2 n=1 Tax=Anolis carolinensis TaxID=28377 RepID=UPI0004627B0F|nr:PREDICTED: apoptosis regulatory protein Siva isoform X2 [Anolis carolinensis]|eukprot:XP_008101806.1 PREDICTED: apoptosis regulatory protein Siva isoform X2 [Anolis carolinensis]
MPKRSCPFGDPAPAQLKTRVRLKELSQGVLGEQYRRAIFEKTKQLLFRGAQTYMENPCIGSTAGACVKAELPEPLTDKPEACSQHKCNGQMLIGLDGKLRQPSAREPDLIMLENKYFATSAPCSRTKMLKTLRTMSQGPARNIF